jgi:hypothetical protein
MANAHGSVVADSMDMLPSLRQQAAAGFVVLAVLGPTRALAQQSSENQTAPASETSPDASSSSGEHAPPSPHMFGVLPNYSTVEDGDVVTRITTKQTFQMAALGSFDPYVFPFVGVISVLNHAPGQSYARRYATSLADNSIGNFLTTAIMPMAMSQDPRYFESGQGSLPRRLAYAASRTVITRDRSGRTQFNVSEIGGNAIAATLSNLYYTRSERTVTGTLTRWGMQVLWDTLSNEMKEVWPDIRVKLHRHAALR